MTSSPWRAADVEILGVLLLAGLVAVAVGWYGAAGEVALTQQLAWANLGIGGLILVGSGILLWLLNGHRAVGALRRDVLERVAQAAPATTAVVLPVVGDEAVASLVTLPGGTLFHRADCALVTGKHALRATPARRRQLRSCGVCLPADPQPAPPTP